MVLMDIWKWYQNCLSCQPLKTQVVSSGILWGFGDVGAQLITHSNTLHMTRLLPDKPAKWLGLRHYHFSYYARMVLPLFSINVVAVNLIFCIKNDDEKLKINWKRVVNVGLFGFGFIGPIGHFWYEGLDRFIRSRLLLKPKSVRFVAAKVAADGLIFGPLDLFAFFTYIGFANGKNAGEVKKDLKRDFLPALMVEGGVWPLVQILNFRYVPVRYQLLYVNVFCLLDSVFLSWLEQQKDAPWKQWMTPFAPLNNKGGQKRE